MAYRALRSRAHPSGRKRRQLLGYGLVLPFEIIYLHQVRGFSTAIAGLILAATMGTSAIATPPTGALLDRYSAKALVIAGSLASAVGYAGFAFANAFSAAALARALQGLSRNSASVSG